MVFKIIFFSQAALELEEAIAWYEIQHPKHGKEFFSIIEISIDKISQNLFRVLWHTEHLVQTIARDGLQERRF